MTGLKIYPNDLLEYEITKLCILVDFGHLV